LEDTETRELFRREAGIWTELEQHPNIVRAYVVDEVAGRLYIGMEYIAPNEQGLNTLEGYLKHQPPDMAQTLRWAIQFCHGMEYAYSRGVRCHRDIKPSNIMITQDKMLKISDFGLAGVIGSARTASRIKLNIQQGRVGLSGSIFEGKGYGTPTHMPAEQFTDAASCDHRSDIYAFGIVLYQMATGGRLPFLAPLPVNESDEERARFGRDMYMLHSKAPVPKLNSPLFHIIQRCLEKQPAKRYQTFKELRVDLEPLIGRQTSETIKLPESKDLETEEWNNKGVSLNNLGRYAEAINCCDKALEINPQDADALVNKGFSLERLGRFEQAIKCLNEALKINPQHEKAWSNKGVSLCSLGLFDEAIRCYDKALEINPKLADAWSNKGAILANSGCVDEAIHCYDKALEINPKLASAWSNKGNSLSSLGRFEQAIKCYEQALKINPQYADAWNNKGNSLGSLGHDDEAIRCYDKALEINPKLADAWSNKGHRLADLGRFEQAIKCGDQALKINPQLADAWSNKGLSLYSLGFFDEAIRCYDKALEINPKDAEDWSNKAAALGSAGHFDAALKCLDKALELNPQDAAAWLNRGLAEDKLGQKQEAAKSYRKFIELAPPQYAQNIQAIRQRLRELKE